MLCPRCQQLLLVPDGRFRWKCDCGFLCGLNFFFDDENLAIKLEVGMSVGHLKLSPRAQELIQSKTLALNELEMAVEISKLPAIKEVEQEETSHEEYNTMMRDIVGRSEESAPGQQYRKMRNGGIISKKRG